MDGASPPPETALRPPLERAGRDLTAFQRTVFSLGALGNAVPGTLTAQLQLYFTKYLGYPAMVLGNVRSAFMVFDALVDPLMGYVSDRTRSRFGRRMPYIAVGSIVLAASFIAMWLAPPGMSLWRIYAFLAVAQLAYSVGVSMTGVPYSALIPELAQDYAARNTLVAWMQAGTYLGTVLGGGVRFYGTWVGNEIEGFRQFAIGGSLFMVGCLWLIVLLIQEPPGDAEHTTRPGASGASASKSESPFQYVARHLAGIFRALAYALGDRQFLPLFLAVFTYQIGVLAGIWMYTFLLDDWFGQTWKTPFALAYVPGPFRDAFFLFTFFAIGCGLLFLPFWNWLGKRWEKRTCLMVGILGVGLSYGASYFLFAPKSYPLFIVYCIVTAFFYTAANIFPTSMLADVATHSALIKGEANEGMFYGAFSFLTKAYNAVSIWWTAFALDHVLHYARGEGAVQTAQTMWRMRVLYAGPPAVAATVSIVFLRYYTLNRKRMAEVTQALDARQGNEARRAEC